MKIKPKTLAVKAEKPKDLAKRVNEAAEKYDSASRRIKEEEEIKAKSNAEIKNLAELFGIKHGNEMLITTSRYEAGYNEIPAPYIDTALAKKVLGDEIFAAVKYRPPIQVDVEKFKQLVDEGTITQQQARKIIQYNPPQRRIVIRPKKGAPTP